MNKKAATLFLLLLKKYKRIRSSKLAGYLMVKGVDPQHTHNYIRHFEKEGVIFREKTMVKNVPHTFIICLASDIDIDKILENITDNRLRADYETFKKHLLDFLDKKKVFRSGELEAMIREKMSNDITVNNMQNLIKRARKEKLIYFVGNPKNYQGLHDSMYAAPDHKLIKEKIPTIKNMYEKVIIKAVLDRKDRKIMWKDLRIMAEEKYGFPSPKFRRAFNNLLTKKYLVYNDSKKFYTLNEEWDYEAGFKYMIHCTKKGESMWYNSNVFTPPPSPI